MDAKSSLCFFNSFVIIYMTLCRVYRPLFGRITVVKYYFITFFSSFEFSFQESFHFDKCKILHQRDFIMTRTSSIFCHLSSNKLIFFYSGFQKKNRVFYKCYVLISSTVCVRNQTIVANIVSSKSNEGIFWRHLYYLILTFIFKIVDFAHFFDDSQPIR